MSATAESLAAPQITQRSKVLARTDARKAYMVALEAEKLRTRLKGTAILRELDRIDTELKEINERLKRGTILLDKEGQPIREADGTIVYIANSVDDGEARAIALRLKTLSQRESICFRKLAKLMPDLKSVEVKDKDESPVAQLGAAIAAAASQDGTDVSQP